MARLVVHTATGPKTIAGKDGDVAICMCGLSTNKPFCSGAHKTIKPEAEDEMNAYDEDGTMLSFEGGHDHEECCCEGDECCETGEDDDECCSGHEGKEKDECCCGHEGKEKDEKHCDKDDKECCHHEGEHKHGKKKDEKSESCCGGHCHHHDEE